MRTFIDWWSRPRHLLAYTALGTFRLIASAAGDDSPQNAISLIEIPSEGRFAIEAKGVDDQTLVKLRQLPPTAPEFSQFLSVRTAAAGEDSRLPPISGRYTIKDRTVRFTPNHPLRRGASYQVQIADITGGRTSVRGEENATPRFQREIRVPDPVVVETRAPNVVRVDPTSETLPENHLNPKEWEITAPAAGSLAPLTLKFPRPLDRALAERCIRILDADGRAVDGQFDVTHGETRWEFIPASAWSVGSHHVSVNPVLEDTAGNSVARAFEVDELRVQDKTSKDEHVSIPFLVVPSPSAR
ncbi:MAG: hypothetical protein NT069_10045 [Planctomycetota bacterium]|nr:hypothetical protein [Planctomycetota bacterium]